MGVEVKGAGDDVVIAERGCNDGCGCRDGPPLQYGALSTELLLRN
jgi:hypothetical protein|nr:MAG TPA: hypothetical protein [Herelleviridae sp.]